MRLVVALLKRWSIPAQVCRCFVVKSVRIPATIQQLEVPQDRLPAVLLFPGENQHGLAVMQALISRREQKPVGTEEWKQRYLK